MISTIQINQLIDLTRKRQGQLNLIDFLIKKLAFKVKIEKKRVEKYRKIVVGERIFKKGV